MPRRMALTVEKTISECSFQLPTFQKTPIFKKVAFLSLVASGFLIFIPFDPFKFFAATARYNKFKYVAAIFIGRAPRYYLLALLGEEMRISPVLMSLIFLILAAIPLGYFIYKKISGKKNCADTIDQKSN